MLITKLLNYVRIKSFQHNIDESHGILHSMNILYYSNKNYNHELIENPQIKDQERIIYVSAILHDMCDKKYMNTNTEIKNIENFLQDKLYSNEIDVVKSIISTMSYSHVKKNGFPDLKEYQTSYNIVRESDLLTAYDFDRSMIYNIRQTNCDLFEAYKNAEEIFNNRINKYISDELFFTEYALKESVNLQKIAIERTLFWKNMFENDSMLKNKTR